MASQLTGQILARATERVPGLRRIPAVRLLALAELALVARHHVARLTPQERRRLVTLVRTAHGRPRNLNLQERDELSVLVAKAAPREFAMQAALKLSPVPIPEPVVRRFSPRS